MVNLGIQTSRMKDYFDLHTILQTFDLSGASVYEAIRAAFARRRTPLPTTTPEALDEALPADSTKQTQWAAFLRKIEKEPDGLDLDIVVRTIRVFSDELWGLLRDENTEQARQLKWHAGTGWQLGGS